MDYRIVEKEAFKIVGLKKRITLIFEGVNHQMDSVLQGLTAENIKELKSLCDIEPKGILSVSTNFSERTVEDLKPQNEEILRQQIRDQINDDILSNSRIRDVRFTTKDVVEQ